MTRLQATLVTTCITVFCAATAIADDAFVTEKSTKRTFPREITLRHGETDFQLQVTGTAVRKKFIVKVYAIAHYMDTASFAGVDEALEAARSGSHASQITMEFARGVGSKKIRDAYRKGFEKNSSESDFSELRPLIALFVAYFDNDMEKNEQIVLRRFPDGTIMTVVAGDEKDALRDEKFASVLWDIWLGEHSIVDRKKLVNLALAEEKEDEEE